MRHNSSIRFQMARLCLYAALIAVFYLIPTAFFEAYPLCPIYHLTGYRCISCGMTRAFSHLFHLNFSAAFAHNPLSLMVFPAFLALVFSDALSFLLRLRGKPCGNLFEWLFKKIFPPRR